MRKMILGGRYVLGERIGKGGMGVVHVGDDLMHDERVAIKLLYPEHAADGLEAASLQREARIGRLIRHPNVVTVFDAGHSLGRPFLVMELVVGRPLRAEARRLANAVDIVVQVLGGLEAIHRAGFVHGDLKTDNVLCGRSADGRDVATIIDLGLARGRIGDDVAAAAAGRRTVSGTPDYVAPEVSLGGAKTIASDLYAVGVILYELCTGSTPFGGGTAVEILRRHVNDVVVPPSLRCPELRISTAFEQVVLRALAKRPEARYADASAFAAALASAGATRTNTRRGNGFSALAPTVELGLELE